MLGRQKLENKVKFNRTITAGTALALLMTAPMGATPLLAAPPKPSIIPMSANAAPVILAQAQSIEELRRRLEEEDLTEEQQAEIRGQIEALEAAGADATETVEETVEEVVPAEEPVAEEAAPEEEPAAEEPVAEEPAAEEAAPAEEEAAPAEEPATEEVIEEESAPEAVEEEQAEPAAEEQPAEEAAPVEDTVTEEVEEVIEEAPAPEAAEEAAPAEEPAAEETMQEEPAATDEQPAEEAPAEETTAEEPADEQPADGDAAPAEPADEDTAEDSAETETQTDPAPVEEPADAAEILPPEDQENAAPLLDSQKETEVSGEAQASQEQTAAEAEAEQAPPPETDAEAQAEAVPTDQEVESTTAAEGTRVDRTQAEANVQQRSDAEIIGEIAGRVILSLAGRQVVGGNDRERLGRGAEEVYYEELRRGRVRETIVRPNGARIVTIRDRYGDVIRRSRITPDGREYVLVYAGDRDDDDNRRERWRDPGRDLPPLRLRIPARDYILDARRADSPDRYYEFLDQPPVERVRRLYSIDEVKYSARVRDSVRRVDLDNITFDFGSASISESEITKLEGLAIAMDRMLDENPAETFLIEGHTDAVGTETANLSLSDRRAETVARALTDVFGIPPENLVTQGYGEDYLKVKTEEPNRTNRRVAVRRITPLVSPVASR